MLGYDREEYVGRHIAEFHADEAVICDILRRLQAGEELHDYPARLRCKDGSVKDVLIDSSVMWEGGRVRPHPLLHPRRHRAAPGRGGDCGTARSGSARWPSRSRSWLGWPGTDGHIYWYNRRWHEYTGTTPEEMEGWGWQRGPRARGPTLRAGAVEASIAGGEPFDNGVPAAEGHDGAVPTRSSRGLAPVRGADREVADGRHATPTSPTAWRPSSELRAAKEEAEAANRAKDAVPRRPLATSCGRR